MLHPEISLLLLLAVAAAVAVLSSRARLPYAIGLVLAGLVLGNLLPYSGPHLSKELLFLVVLPGLLFEAAFQIQFSEVWRARGLILSLAVPGLLVATLLTALLLWWGVNLFKPGAISFIEAMVFGALISATDPISVLAIFRSLGVDRRLSVIVEAESLFNDGTAVVIFSIVLSMATGAGFGIGGAVWEFFRVAVLAVAVGIAVGVVVSLLARSINDPMVEITLTVLSAYGSFIAAEFLGLSGVIACVAAGMVSGNWGAPLGMQPATRAAVDVLELRRISAQQLRIFAHGSGDQAGQAGSLFAGNPDWLGSHQCRACRAGVLQVRADARGGQCRAATVLGQGAHLGRIARWIVNGSGLVTAARFQSPRNDSARDLRRRALDVAGAGADH